MRKRRNPPSYRKHKASGQAIVTLSGRDFYLGPYGTDVSKQEYDRRVGEWLVNGGNLAHDADEPSLTVGQVLVKFWEHALSYYGDGTDKLKPELYHQRKNIRLVRRLYSRTPAESFGPLALKACRAELEKEHVRKMVNQHVSRIKAIFRWAVENELIAPSVFHGLSAVSGLRKGRSTAKEGKRVRPVSDEHIEAVLPKLSPTVRAMVEVQLLTVMRPGELVIMRGKDIDKSSEEWVYRPAHHKTEHLDYERAIDIGPKARAILEPYLEAAGQEYVFSPMRAEEARNARRKLRRKSKRSPSQLRRKRKTNRKRAWRERYSVDSYRRAIERACKAAKIEKWTPHRLRHTGATRIRAKFGLDHARSVMGQRSAEVAAIYAEMDRGTSATVMAIMG